jgi:hypothetical protein
MKLYINYPQPHLTIHWDPGCNYIRQHRRERQRFLRVTWANRDRVLTDFGQGEYRFKAESYYNDMWLDVNLSSPEAERAFADDLRSTIGRRYRPLATAEIKEHCRA